MSVEDEMRSLRAEVARLRNLLWGCSHPDRSSCGCPEAVVPERDRLRAEVAELRGEAPPVVEGTPEADDTDGSPEGSSDPS